MLALQTQRIAIQGGKGNDLEGLIEKGTSLAEKFGYEPSELLGRLLGGDDEPSGPSFIEVLPKLVGVVGDVMKKGIDAKAAPAALPAPPPYIMPPPPRPEAPAVPVAAEPEPDPVLYDEAASELPPPPTLPLTILKPARKAARKLIRDLRDAEDEEYVSKVLQAISMELHLLTYLENSSIDAVAEEAGASAEEIDKIIRLVDESGLVDENIQRR